MKVWIDGQALQTASRNRGIGRYAAEIIRSLVALDNGIDFHISLNAELAKEAIAARTWIETFLPAENIHIWHGIAGTGEGTSGYSEHRQLSELALAHHVNCISPDIAISLSPFEGFWDAAVPLLPSASVQAPVHAIFYDAIPHRFPEQYLSIPNVAAAYKRRFELHQGFESLLCISEFALSEAKAFFPDIAAVKISAGLSASFISLISQETVPASSEQDPYLLYVGGLDWRKNVEVIPKAIAQLEDELKGNVSLLIAGDHPEGELETLQTLWNSLDLPSASFKSLGLVSDHDLVNLYRRAAAVIQPSRMEGFGLTALEALAVECPVIAARRGALPEVVGIEDLLFEPDDPEQLARLIERALSDKAIAALVKQRSGCIQNEFNWKKTAQTTASHLEASNRGIGEARPLTDLRDDLAQSALAISPICDNIAKIFALAEPAPTSPQRLIVDATSTIQHQHKTGIQRVVRKICSEIGAAAAKLGVTTHIVFCEDEAGWFEVDKSLPAKPEKTSARAITPSQNDIWLLLDSSWDMIEHHESALYEARLRGAQVITCHYDNVPLITSAFCSPGLPPIFKDRFLRMLEVSTGFVCISNAVAEELKSILKAMDFPHTLAVDHWRLGADFADLPDTTAASIQREQENQQFIMVGTLEPRKGHLVAINAFEKYWQLGGTAELIIIGKFGWEAGHIQDRILEHDEYGQKLHWQKSIDDEGLARLYQESDALIAASYAEGFGLPIVEAAHFGTAVIASDIPVFREVSQTANRCLFFPAGDHEALAEAILKFASSDNKSGSPSDQSKQWPTWKESADELAHLLINGSFNTFSPDTQNTMLNNNTGKKIETEIVEEAQSQCQLEIIEGFSIDPETDTINVKVKISNLSSRPWFGSGTDNGFGVALSYHLLTGDKSVFKYENPRSKIELVLPPEGHQFLRVTIPADEIRAGAKYMQLEMVQEGVRWWGNPLTAQLPEIPILQSLTSGATKQISAKNA